MFKIIWIRSLSLFSSPGLSWNAKFKIASVELELISSIDVYLFVENSIKGDISYIAKRYRKAKNKSMKLYDDRKRSKYITYLDANNLYGWAMSQYLSYSGFKWLNQKKIDVNLISENSFT